MHLAPVLASDGPHDISRGLTDWIKFTWLFEELL
jgi:hypothetical protein